MRILVLNYEFPPIGGGGGRFTADLCRHLARFGHELRVQTSHFRGLPCQEVQEGYEIYRTWAGRRQAHTCTVPEMAVFLATNLIPALKHAASWRPQVVNVHFAVPTGVLAWVIRKVTGIPYVLSAQLGDVPGGVPVQTDHLFRWLKPLTTPIWRDAAAVTVPSAEVAELVQRAYGLTAHVIPNGVELEALDPLPPGVPLHRLEKRRPWQLPGAVLRLARVIDATRPAAVVSAFAHPNLVTGCALGLARSAPAWLARVSSPPDCSSSSRWRSPRPTLGSCSAPCSGAPRRWPKLARGCGWRPSRFG